MVDLSRVTPFYHKYIALAADKTLIHSLQANLDEMGNYFSKIAEAKHEYAYAEGKWTIKQVLQHMCDTERVFSYRALGIARGDQSNFPSFDENAYAQEAATNNREWNTIWEEFKALRTSNIYMFQSFSAAQLEYNGLAAGNPTYVKAIGYMMVGHCLHHLQILGERYI